MPKVKYLRKYLEDSYVRRVPVTTSTACLLLITSFALLIGRSLPPPTVILSACVD